MLNCCGFRRKKKYIIDSYKNCSESNLNAIKLTLDSQKQCDYIITGCYTISGIGLIIATVATIGLITPVTIPSLALVGIGIGDKINSIETQKDNINHINHILGKKSKYGF